MSSFANAEQVFAPEERRAIIEVTQRPWFSRLWVWQEVLASRELVLQSGSETLSFDDLYILSPFLDVDLDSHDASGIGLSETAAILHDDFNFPHSEEAEGDNWIFLTSPATRYAEAFLRCCCGGSLSGATDGRDRLYSLIGLINIKCSFPKTSVGADGEHIAAAPLPINYSRSLGKVYQDAVKWLINTSRSLKPLEIPRTKALKPSGDFPSWIIHWCDKCSPTIFADDGPYVTVGTPEDVKVLPHLQDLERIGKLSLSGSVIGQLSEQIVRDDLKSIGPSPGSKGYLRHLLKEGHFCCRSMQSPSSQPGPTQHWEDVGVIVPACYVAGDLLVPFRGSSCLFLIRRKGQAPEDVQERQYHFISVCYWWTTHQKDPQWFSDKRTKPELHVFENIATLQRQLSDRYNLNPRGTIRHCREHGPCKSFQYTDGFRPHVQTHTERPDWPEEVFKVE